MEKQRKLWCMWGSIFTALGVMLDQWTKLLASRHLKGGADIIIIKDIFRLHYLENRGAAFGVMQGQKVFFIIATLVLLALALYFYLKLPYTRRFAAFRVCMAAAAAGGIGNFIDRLWKDYVVDFFYFELIDFPIFNVADIYVVVSLFVFFYLAFFYFKDDDYKYLTFGKAE